MESALRVLLPKIIGSLSFEVYPHQCKEELLQHLPERLKGYASWIPPGWRILVVVDRDDDDCAKLRARLDRMAADAGLLTKSAARKGSFAVVNRLAIEELEAWYFGDWEAVRTAYPRVSETVPAKKKYRHPDAIRGGTWETFERLLQASGYFVGGLRKIEAARTIAEHMDPSRNRSPSFAAMRDALAGLSGTTPARAKT